MPLIASQILQNRYRIVKLIGQGGFGAVYRAWDMNLKRPCAVKENLDASAEAQKQFNQEMELLARLYHNSLPRIYDYFFIPGTGQYMVMDFIEGEDLQAMLTRRGRLPEVEVIPWIVQICDALSYMHSQKPAIIHRDIKPANIIVTPDGRAMLVDFGISKVHDPLLKTTVGARAVTPGFSPWEQYGQGSTDSRSDVYALGATLYALLTGQEPPESIALMGGAATLVPPRQLNPTISPHLGQAIERAMKTHAMERFATAADMSQALHPPAPQPQLGLQSQHTVLPQRAPQQPPVLPSKSSSLSVPIPNRIWVWSIGAIFMLILVPTIIINALRGDQQLVISIDPQTLADYCLRNPNNCIIEGVADAPVTVVEISDYSCIHCRNFSVTTAPLLHDEYVENGVVRWIVLPFGLRSTSVPPAAAAMCAAAQGHDRFLQMHLGLFSLQEADGNFLRDNIMLVAVQAGLDMDDFTNCFDSDRYTGIVEENIRQANLAGVFAVPAFFINDVKREGNQPLNSFRQLIESARTTR